MHTDLSAFFYPLLFIVAFLYACVGHGGASGFIALMVLYDFAPANIKPTALLLNIFVSGVSFFQFYRSGHFQLKTFLPFAVASIPLSFVGGMMTVDGALYKKLLGVLLLLPALKLLISPDTSGHELVPFDRAADRKLRVTSWSLLIGGVIGLLSGMIGIGGGIILSPVLLMLRWTDQKQTAAISALFILVNSLSGLAGQTLNGFRFDKPMLITILIAFSGGLCGAYLGALKFNQTVIKNMLALVLLIASFKLIFSA